MYVAVAAMKRRYFFRVDVESDYVKIVAEKFSGKRETHITKSNYPYRSLSLGYPVL
jgi:hypothetical protein